MSKTIYMRKTFPLPKKYNYECFDTDNLVSDEENSFARWNKFCHHTKDLKLKIRAQCEVE